MKLWIDTDPGVDDALALLMALAEPRAQVLGLGIVGGNVGLAACCANALKLLEAMARDDVPVHAGADAPLMPVRAADAGHVHGSDGFGDVGLRRARRSPAQSHAALALIEAVQRHPGEVTLVSLGPLTNVALAMALEPTLASALAGWVCMGGAVGARGNTEYVTSEFNFAFDPEAAAICFERGPVATVVDWELVLRHGVDMHTFETWLAVDSTPARLYRAISRRTRDFKRRRGGAAYTPADALAMTVALDADSVRGVESRALAVEVAGQLSRGQSVVDWRGRSGRHDNARIVTAVDDARHQARLRAALT